MHLANRGWLGVAHHSRFQTIYQDGYLPDYSTIWKGHEWTRQIAYTRSKEELGIAVNPQGMHYCSSDLYPTDQPVLSLFVGSFVGSFAY